MRSSRRTVALVLPFVSLFLAAAAASAAEKPPSPNTVMVLNPPTSRPPFVTFTPGGGAVRLPAVLNLERTRPQVGGILGITLAPHFALELRGHTFTSSGNNQSATFVHAEGNLTWFLTRDAWLAPYLTAGGGAVKLHSKYSPAGNGGGGFLFRFSPNLGLRVEARDERMRIPGSGSRKFRDTPELFAGLSFGIGALAKDSDFDGVPDKRDRCPGTPRGARVDLYGCPIDGDGDGVYDGLDRCPGTPPGCKVDASGCPIDSDRDGVCDGVDKCPNTPFGAVVDIHGCPFDGDKDGVPDGIDQCPATPLGCVVDAEGCEIDSDHDGVCDGLDKCPDTPRSARVDLRGCPIVVSEKETELLETGMIRLQNVNFAVGSAELDSSSFQVLDEVGGILTKWPELRIEIGGHTDASGSAAKNQALSEARAKAVLEHLMVKFSDLGPDQFTAVGYGASQPIADDRTELGRAKNRRVEFKVLNKEALRRQSEQRKVVPREHE